MDMSYRYITESVSSPEKSMQVNGRLNRWGTIETECHNTIFKPKNYRVRQSEDSAVSLNYTTELSGMWYDYIKRFDGKILTKDELYVIYDEYCKINKNAIRNFIESNYNKSSEALSKIYPKHYHETSEKMAPNANSNMLRSDGSEVYTILKHRITGEYIDPVTTQIYNDSFDKTFHESENIMSQLIQSYKEGLSDDPRFNFKKSLKNKKYLTIDEIRRLAVRSDTPYVRFDAVYDPFYGIILKNSLDKLGL